MAQAFPETAIGWVAFAGIVMGAIAFLAGSWRRGRGDALKVAREEIQVLEDARVRTERDLQAARVKCAEDIGVLTGKVDRLEVENAEMRDRLALLSPEVLIAAMQTAAAENREHYDKTLSERLRPLEQGMDRLLTQGGNE